MRAKFVSKLYESLNIQSDDILTDKFIKDFLDDEFVIENCIRSYEIDNNNNNRFDISEINSDEYLENEDFIEYAKYLIESKFFEVYNMLEDLIENDRIKIWRSITVNKSWLSQLPTSKRPLGIYWSWDKNAAEPYWGYNDKEFSIPMTLQSSVNINDIDWVPTFKGNMHPNYEEEKEITIKKGASLKIEAIIDEHGKELNINKIKTKIFKV